MGSKIFGFVVIVGLCVAGYYIYDHYHQEKQLASGEVTWDSGQPTPEQKAAFDKENSGETPDGQNEHKQHTAAQDANAVATGQAEVGPDAGASPVAPAAPTNTVAPPATVTPAPAPATQPAPAPAGYTLGNGTSPANLPTRDTLPANAPNELHFSGSGTYQWYRQGNLTYRVDTASGRSCIAYATMEEWRKPIVSSHGCGRGA
jgi:hypothetical protein